jgi:hypothetical protein
MKTVHGFLVTWIAIVMIASSSCLAQEFRIGGMVGGTDNNRYGLDAPSVVSL